MDSEKNLVDKQVCVFGGFHGNKERSIFHIFGFMPKPKTTEGMTPSPNRIKEISLLKSLKSNMK